MGDGRGQEIRKMAGGRSRAGEIDEGMHERRKRMGYGRGWGWKKGEIKGVGEMEEGEIEEGGDGRGWGDGKR